MIYHLTSHINNIAYNYSPYSTISIYTVNYRKDLFPKMDLTRIHGIITYDALHQIQLDIKPTLFMFTQTPGVPLT